MTQSDDDIARTRLAAERTWLAWWRSGIAASAVAVGVGGVVPRLIEGSRTAYIVLGVGYAALSAGVFAGAALRRRSVERALDRGQFAEVGGLGVMLLTIAAMALALGTLAIIIVQP